MELETISAIATPPGEGGIGIIRVSGSSALMVAEKLFRAVSGQKVTEMKSHTVNYGQIIDSSDNSIVDEAVLLIMRAPNSYTREDVVEIQCHGGQTAVRRILELTLIHGARIAEPGEFTKRAFLNGRLDLTQAQAVMDIIRAKTDASLKLAVGQLEGAFSERIKMFRHDILEMIAHLEAAIDFPEDDIDELASDDTREQVLALKENLAFLLATAKTGRIMRDGLETAIIGRPNVGKSSLLNELLQENRAIVTNIPGTTRDVIEEYVNIDGIPLKIIDTAGIRQTDDIVEKIGVEKSREYMKRADLVLMMLDMSEKLSAEDAELLEYLQGRQAIVLINKNDLPAVLDMDELQQKLSGQQIIQISTLTGQGMPELKAAITAMVYDGNVQQGESVMVNNVRQAELLRQADCYLDDVMKTIENEMSPDFIVIDLRTAWEKLGEITGETVGDDIVDQIFANFCLGK